MKRMFLFSFLALIPAALVPLAAIGQVSSTSGSKSSDELEKTFKYEVYAGYAYTSLNQVNQSRYGLSGVNLSVTRDWGRYFGLIAEGDYYKFPFGSPEVVDSTAAGDAFNGGFAVALSEGLNVVEATRFGCVVAGLSVTRHGTAPSMPRRAEVEKLMPSTKTPIAWSGGPKS